MSAHIQPPTIQNDEELALLQGVINDSQTRILAIQKEKARIAQENGRKVRLQQLTESIAEHEAGIAQFENELIPAAMRELDEAILARFKNARGRYSQMGASAGVQNASAKLIVLKDGLLQRRETLEKVQERRAELAAVVEVE